MPSSLAVQDLAWLIREVTLLVVLAATAGVLAWCLRFERTKLP